MKSIAISDQAHKEVKTLCKILDLNIGEFVQYSALYFKKTGADPSKPETESPHKIVKELERRLGQVITHIKTQEEEKLAPLYETLLMLSRRMETMVGDAPKESTFKAVLSRTESMINDDQDHHLEQLKKLDKYYTEQSQRLEKSTTEMIRKMNELIAKLDKMA